MDFMERLEMMCCIPYLLTWFMVNANEAYLTTMNELAVNDVLEIRSFVMARCTIG
ncbi:17543_t:CDS:2 [Gigaspora rosea]|nr:17543_t:CDS:2 [Gigaspora rosea]